MWWWIGGVAGYLVIGFWWSYSAGRESTLLSKAPTEKEVAAVAVACLLWPLTTLCALACVVVVWGIANRKRTDAKSADQSA